jgi:hypothetical protein
MQSKSRTCIDCSIIPLVVTSNSGHRFTADIIGTLLFEDVLSCFKGGSSSTQVAVYVLKSQLFGNVFSNLTVGPLYLFPCLTSCCLRNAFFNPRQRTPSIRHSIQQSTTIGNRSYTFFYLHMILVRSCNSISILHDLRPWHSIWVLQLVHLLQFIHKLASDGGLNFSPF